MPGMEQKTSVFKLGHNFSVDMFLGTRYESIVLTTPTTVTTIHFVLRVVSAEFHTNRSEARHKRRLRKQPLLDSYLCNLPNSAKGCTQYHNH